MKNYSKTINTFTGHSMFISSIDKSDMPKTEDNFINGFTKFYKVQNWNAEGDVFFYLCSGNSNGNGEICGFYSNGSFWSHYGTNLKEACEGMMRDGWMYTRPINLEYDNTEEMPLSDPEYHI